MGISLYWSRRNSLKERNESHEFYINLPTESDSRNTAKTANSLFQSIYIHGVMCECDRIVQYCNPGVTTLNQFWNYLYNLRNSVKYIYHNQLWKSFIALDDFVNNCPNTGHAHFRHFKDPEVNHEVINILEEHIRP